ncbi:uncharacterized protein LOC101238731 [Hydra vulgaris]|uniref:uncharacterized protein LOC101238731 n=1 Tax=Hydra vulgaris TaxID=6087 RepID=UPI001F5F6D41|nr:uncharacterized protein LOC101238731 [Hydra vulgaris]
MRAKTEKKDRYAAFVLKEEGYSIRQIAERLGRSHSCIINIIQRYKETGSINDCPRTGRNKISNDRDVRSLVRLMKENRQASSTDLSTKWTLSNGLKASPRTVQRVLQILNYLWRAAAKKPRLNKKQKFAR